MNSSGGDSDDNSWKCLQSANQRQLVGRHYRPGPTLEDIFTVQIYDIRNTRRVVPVKYETFTIDSTSESTLTKIIAERYDISCDILQVDTRTNEVVICEDKDLHIVFISFRTYHEPRVPISQYTEQGCIGVVSGTTVKSLKTVIRDYIQGGRGVALFVKGKRVSDDSLVNSCVEYRGRLLCVEERKLKVSCFHRPRQKTENKYTMQCLNTHNVRELKEIFRETFSDDFPGLLTGTHEVWFTKGKHVLKDSEFMFIHFSSRQGYQERGRLMVHVKPYSSFPVTVKVMSDSKENDQFSVLVSELLNPHQLRAEISLFINHHPNSLHLTINNKKLRTAVFTADTKLAPQSTVLVKVVDRINVSVLADLCSCSSLRKVNVDVYKLDDIQHLKRKAADLLTWDPNDMQIFFSDQELTRQKLLGDYRIRDGDTLYAVHFHDTVHLIIRQPGQPGQYLTVGDYRRCTVQEVKRYLAKALGLTTGKINLIHLGICLDDEDTLFEAGLSSGDTLIVPRSSDTDELINEIKRIFISVPNNPFLVTLAVEKAGILFYVPGSATVSSPEERLAVSKQSDSQPYCMMLSTAPSTPSSPRGSTSSTISLHHCYKAMFGIMSSVESESGIGPNDRYPINKSDDQVALCNTEKNITRPFTKLIIPNYHSDPGPSALKRLTTCRELTKEGDKVIFRESSVYEEDMSNDSDGNILPLRRKRFPTSSECETSDAASPQPRSFRSPSLIFPPQVIQNTILSAVSMELGHSWRRVALALGLTHTDIESLEYRYHGNLQEQALQALLLWKQRSSRQATTAKLRDVLKDCGLSLVADAVTEESKYDTT